MFPTRTCSNLVPRVSPLHVPGSKREETLVGAGHVSHREKLDPERGPSLAIFCQDLLSTPLCCAKLTRNSFNWLCFSVFFILRVIETLIWKLNKVRCLEALYFEKSLCINDKINSGRTAPSPSIHRVSCNRGLFYLWMRRWKIRSEDHAHAKRFARKKRPVSRVAATNNTQKIAHKQNTFGRRMYGITTCIR